LKTYTFSICFWFGLLEYSNGR